MALCDEPSNVLGFARTGVREGRGQDAGFNSARCRCEASTVTFRIYTVFYFPAEMPSSAAARYFLPCRDAVVRMRHDIYFPAEMLIVGAHTILNSLPSSLARKHHRTFNLARISLSILKQIVVS
jgi:hypothetical protein